MRWAVALVILGACSEPPGMHVLVNDPDGTAVRVEMFVGVERGTYSSLQPADAARFDGEVLWREEDAPASSVMLADGQAVFALRPRAGEAASEIEMIAVVAYDANDAVTGLATLRPTRAVTDESVGYVVDLVPARFATPSLDTPIPARVHTWGERCIGIEQMNGTDQFERTWLVPKDDPDCDGLANECRADEWEESAPRDVEPKLENKECYDVVDGTKAGRDRSCRVGAYFGCASDAADDPDSDTACTAFGDPRYCVPAGFCDGLDCLENSLACAVFERTRITCELLSSPVTGAPCTGARAALLDLSLRFNEPSQPSGITGCEDASLGLRVSAFSDEQQFDHGANGEYARVKIGDGEEPCQYQVLFDEGTLPDSFSRAGLVKVDFPDDRHLVVPILIKRHPGQCPASSGGPPSVCQLEITEEDLVGIPACLQ